MSPAWSVSLLSAAVLVLAAGALPSAPAPFASPPRRDAVAVEWQRLRGTWVITCHETNGRPEKSLLIGQEVGFGRGTFDYLGRLPCRLEPGRNPKRMHAAGVVVWDV